MNAYNQPIQCRLFGVPGWKQNPPNMGIFRAPWHVQVWSHPIETTIKKWLEPSGSRQMKKHTQKKTRFQTHASFLEVPPFDAANPEWGTHFYRVREGVIFPPRKLTWQWKTNHEWRCISYSKWGYSNGVLYWWVFPPILPQKRRNIWQKIDGWKMIHFPFDLVPFFGEIPARILHWKPWNWFLIAPSEFGKVFFCCYPPVV